MKFLKQLLLSGFTFILCMGVIELYIQATHLGELSNTEFYPDRGRGKRANFNYLMFNEGFGIGRYNQFSYLGEGRPPEKKPNTIRIALLGDSFIEAWQVFERHQFSTIAEQELRKKFPGKTIEVLNFGHSNLDFPDQYVYFKQFAEKFNPDITLFLLADYNLDPRYVDALRPKALIENDSLVIKNDFEPSEVAIYEKTKFLTQNSSIMHMLNICRKKAQGGMAEILLDKIYFWINPPKPRVEEEKSAYSVHPVTLKILDDLSPESVAIVGRDINALPPEFRNACLERGFPYFSLSPQLQAMMDGGIDPYDWPVTGKSGHWNHKGNKMVGRQLASFLAELLEEKPLP